MEHKRIGGGVECLHDCTKKRDTETSSVPSYTTDAKCLGIPTKSPRIYPPLFRCEQKSLLGRGRVNEQKKRAPTTVCPLEDANPPSGPCIDARHTSNNTSARSKDVAKRAKQASKITLPDEHKEARSGPRFVVPHYPPQTQPTDTHHEVGRSNLSWVLVTFITKAKRT